MPPLVWGQANLRAAAGPARPWLWHGYLAPGAVTLLTGQWKAGKTTLASVLLARLQAGGALAGRPLAAGQALVLSEEPAEHWHRRSQHLDFGEHVGWFCQPFLGHPRPDEWQAFVEGVAALRERRDFDLVLIDPLAAFFPSRAEGNAGCMLDALAPLRHLTRRGLSVLVLHHPGKGEPPVGQLARGSGALSAYADILLEMRFYPKAPEDDRRRWLQALSRFPEMPLQKVIEWTADGTDYLSRGTFVEEEFAGRWEVLRAILAEATWKYPRREVLRRWPTPPAARQGLPGPLAGAGRRPGTGAQGRRREQAPPLPLLAAAARGGLAARPARRGAEARTVEARQPLVRRPPCSSCLCRTGTCARPTSPAGKASART
jgi:hypothetical protein